MQEILESWRIVDPMLHDTQNIEIYPAHSQPKQYQSVAFPIKPHKKRRQTITTSRLFIKKYIYSAAGACGVGVTGAGA